MVQGQQVVVGLWAMALGVFALLSAGLTLGGVGPGGVGLGGVGLAIPADEVEGELRTEPDRTDSWWIAITDVPLVSPTPTSAPTAFTVEMPPTTSAADEMRSSPAIPPVAARSIVGVAIWFERDGEPIVVSQPWLVAADVTTTALRQGPGHYPSTVLPGQPGNVGIAGHRTTHGAPFWALDALQPGDEVHLASDDGHHWVYRVIADQVVDPTDVWVLDDDVWGAGRSLLTLTTCHPRSSAAQRLVVWAELDRSVV